MEKKETNTLSIFQRPVWVSLFALTAAISWGWAYPLIKMGMEEYQITADMTGSKMLFAGIRFFISGIIILAIARSSHRKFGFKKKAVQENVWFLLLYALAPHRALRIIIPSPRNVKLPLSFPPRFKARMPRKPMMQPNAFRHVILSLLKKMQER